MTDFTPFFSPIDAPPSGSVIIKSTSGFEFSLPCMPIFDAVDSAILHLQANPSACVSILIK